jgi:hypothetical protein
MVRLAGRLTAEIAELAAAGWEVASSFSGISYAAVLRRA